MVFIKEQEMALIEQAKYNFEKERRISKNRLYPFSTWRNLMLEERKEKTLPVQKPSISKGVLTSWLEKKIPRRFLSLFGLIFIVIFTASFVISVFPALPKYPLWEGSSLMRLSRVKLILDNFPFLPYWNTHWFFGAPFLRFYPPLCFYLMALISWVSGVQLLQVYPAFTAIIFTVGILSTYFSVEICVSTISAQLHLLYCL